MLRRSSATYKVLTFKSVIGPDKLFDEKDVKIIHPPNYLSVTIPSNTLSNDPKYFK